MKPNISKRSAFARILVPTEQERATLQDLDDLAIGLQRDLTIIAEDLRLDASNSVEALFCIDFDVIRSSLNWLEDQSVNGLFSSLCIQFNQSGSVLLPGTLFELQNFLAKRFDRSPDSRSNAFAETFLNELYYSSTQNVDQSQERFDQALSQFKSSELIPKDLFLLNILKQSIRESSYHQFEKLNPTIFSHASDILSQGARADRWINNRVDAINYSLAHKMNQSVRRSGRRYVVVSNAPSMQRLDTAFGAIVGWDGASNYIAEGTVRSARMAAIYQMLVFAGQGVAGGERIAFKMLADLAQYRAQIRQVTSMIHKYAGKSDEVALSIKGHFLKLLSSFDVFQNIIDDFRQNTNHRLALFQHEYLAKDPAAFYLEMSEQISVLLKTDGYLVPLSVQDLDKIELSIRRRLRDTRFTYKAEFSVEDIMGNSAAIVRQYKDHNAFFTISKPPITEFFRTINLVKSKIFSKLTKNEYRTVAGSETDTVVLGITNGSIEHLETPARADYVLFDLCAEFDVLPEDVLFARIDNEWFSASFEADLVAITTKYQIPEEIALFLDELMSVVYKNKGIDNCIKRFFKYKGTLKNSVVAEPEH